MDAVRVRGTEAPSVVLLERPESGLRIGRVDEGDVTVSAGAMRRLAVEPVGVGDIGLSADPGEGSKVGDVIKSDPQRPVGAGISGEGVIDPVLFIRVIDGGKMTAYLGRPGFRPEPVGGVQHVIVMPVGIVKERAGDDDQVGVNPIGQHRGQPFHQGSAHGEIGRIDPAFHGEPSA